MKYMKCLGFLSLAGCLMVSAQAQLFSPSSMTGAALGGLAGGIIGHNNGRHTAEGVGIGAGIGLVVGALADHQERRIESPAPAYGYYSQPVYVERESERPNLPISGALVGGIAGGVIGHNNGGHTAEGVAIGAGAGLLLGGLAQPGSYYHRPVRRVYLEQPPVYYATPPQPTYVTVQPPPVVVPQTQTEPVVQSTTPIIQASAPAGSPAMSGANSLFGR